jgi:hypothetical protein
MKRNSEGADDDVDLGQAGPRYRKTDNDERSQTEPNYGDGKKAPCKADTEQCSKGRQ